MGNFGPGREEGESSRDLVLYPGEYAYIQDTTKGTVKTHVGPTVVSQTGQQRPVVFQDNRFRQCKLMEAVQSFPRAKEGEYIILENPAREGKFPVNGEQSFELLEGERTIIPGPAYFPLWPGQFARIITGHKLASNEYLIVRVYNEEKARTNWGKARIVKADTKVDEETSVSPSSASLEEFKIDNLTMGQRIVIKGTEISFYIPPTGVEVVAENERMNAYVRDAVTLERLEYCILVDEDGNKRYPRGPNVVFPKATEMFIEDKKGNRKFKAIELNSIQGIHVKVIQSYKEDDVSYKEGQELFITGQEAAIYYPREEHSIIQYGKGNRKHFAISIPKGEARYVLDRESGDVVMVRGPKMLLPNPITNVVVRRPLTDDQCDLWYPGNQEAKSYNSQLRSLSVGQAPSARSGFVSEGDYRKEYASSAPQPVAFMADTSEDEAFGNSRRSKASEESVAPEITRGTTYTPPRTITIDSKYDGVPAIRVWNGYAICVVSKTGDRKIVQGPETVLLEYDETLEVITLSTGKPKNTDNVKRDVYLRVKNNYITDIILAETSDHVQVEIKLSYRCNFLEENSDKWFDVENYVKAICDHLRSILKGTIKKYKVEDFYANPSVIIRDAVLGEKDEKTGKRTGRLFEENGLHVWDVEVLATVLKDSEIAMLLGKSQHEVVRDTLSLNAKRRELERVKEEEEIARQIAEARNTTSQHRFVLQQKEIAAKLEAEVAGILATVQRLTEERKISEAKEKTCNFEAEQRLSREKLEESQQFEFVQQQLEMDAKRTAFECEAMVAQLNAANGTFAEAITVLGRDVVAAEVAKAMSIPALIGGENFLDVIGKIPALSVIVDRFNSPEAGNRLANMNMKK